MGGIHEAMVSRRPGDCRASVLPALSWSSDSMDVTFISPGEVRGKDPSG